MEASLIFSGLVLAMCALHLLWNASGRLETWWRQQVPPVTKRRGAVQRSDWYAFFHCADLVGPDPAAGKTRETQTVAPDRQVRRQPRMNAC